MITMTRGSDARNELLYTLAHKERVVYVWRSASLEISRFWLEGLYYLLHLIHPIRWFQ